MVDPQPVVFNKLANRPTTTVVRVEVAFGAIVGVADGRVTREHIYGDQASVLVQIGLLNPTGLPVSGAEQARLVLDHTLDYRTDH